MKTLFILFAAIYSFSGLAQEDTCLEKIMKQKGSWKMNKNPESSPPAELAIQKKMVQASHDMLQKGYEPMGVRLEWAGVYPPVRKEDVIAGYSYTLSAFNFLCKDDGSFTTNHETNTGFEILFNTTLDELWDTVEAGQRAEGFFSLRHGIPVEIGKGIWAFPDKPEALGFGQTGRNRMWIITYDGKLPWSYVSRKEFLLKRKRTVMIEKESSLKGTRETIGNIEREISQKEQELKSDPVKLEKLMKGTYIPMRENYQKILRKTESDYQMVLEKLDEQLGAPESELKKNAIVIPGSKDSRYYSFADKEEPFSLILIQPNPSYFNRALQRSIPQVITVEFTWNHKHPVMTSFAKGINKVVDLDFLRSLIGKSAIVSVPSGRGNAYAPPVQGAGSETMEDYVPVVGQEFSRDIQGARKN